MADDEFNIQEMISGPDRSDNNVVRSNTRNTPDTGDTSTKKNTSTTLHPFSVRLDQQYVDIIKALAWWKRISQREFIEQCLNKALDEMDDDHLKTILNKYNN